MATPPASPTAKSPPARSTSWANGVYKCHGTSTSSSRCCGPAPSMAIPACLPAPLFAQAPDSPTTHTSGPASCSPNWSCLPYDCPFCPLVRARHEYHQPALLALPSCLLGCPLPKGAVVLPRASLSHARRWRPCAFLSPLPACKGLRGARCQRAQCYSPLIFDIVLSLARPVFAPQHLQVYATAGRRGTRTCLQVLAQSSTCRFMQPLDAKALVLACRSSPSATAGLCNC